MDQRQNVWNDLVSRDREQAIEVWPHAEVTDVERVRLVRKAERSATGNPFLEPKRVLRASVGLDMAAQEFEVDPEVLHDASVVTLQAGCQRPERRPYGARNPRGLPINHVGAEFDFQDRLTQLFLASTLGGA
jgi:hypothetical protein